MMTGDVSMYFCYFLILEGQITAITFEDPREVTERHRT